MPKGDRFKLKADPENGTTPIANLLLEATAMAKISGLQKGAIIYLWRQTYGWLVDGKRLKEAKITLKDWEYNLCATKSRISTALKELEESNIIKRRVADQWGGYYYTLNTNIMSWNHNVINIARLSEVVGVANFGTVAQNGTVITNKNSYQKGQQLPEMITVPKRATHKTEPKNGGLPKTATVAQNGTEQLPKTEPPTLYKEILKKELKKGSPHTIKKVSNNPFIKKLQGYLGYPDKVETDPIPNPAKEAKFIKKMLDRGFKWEEVFGLWKKKVDDRGEFVSMQWVNEDIGKKENGTHRQGDKAVGKSAGHTQAHDPRDYTRGKYGHLVQH